MTLDDFKTYLVTHLWKQGDQTVIDNLDLIIKTAMSELNRTFKVEDRVDVVPLLATSIAIPLPDDCQEIRHLYRVGLPLGGEMKYVIPADLANDYAYGTISNKFTVKNRMILLAGGTMTVSAPETFNLWYYKKLSDFDTTLADDYFDVFLYCTLKHSAPFLREDERLGVWSKMYGEAVGSALIENDDRKYAGSPLKMKFSKGIR